MTLFKNKYKVDRVRYVSGTLWQIYKRKWFSFTWKPIRQVFATEKDALEVIRIIKAGD